MLSRIAFVLLLFVVILALALIYLATRRRKTI